MSAHRPYDLVCQRGDTELHVEVKGLSGPAVRIQLTPNAVEHARGCPHAVLAVVSDIGASPARSDKDDRGSIAIIEPWRIDDSRLRPTAYSYSLT